jgi:quercetin dioxygenase-like cupin family protein
MPFDVVHPPLAPMPEGRQNTILNYQAVDINLLDFIDSFDTYPIHQEYFIFAPGGRIIIHTDDESIRNICKLNMFIGTGLLGWFEPLPEFKNKKVSYTDIGTPYLWFQDYEVTQVHQEQMFGNHIINPGIPHNFINNSSEVVWIVSLLLGDKKTKTFLDFEDAVERFRNYIV